MYCGGPSEWIGWNGEYVIGSNSRVADLNVHCTRPYRPAYDPKIMYCNPAGCVQVVKGNDCTIQDVRYVDIPDASPDEGSAVDEWTQWWWRTDDGLRGVVGDGIKDCKAGDINTKDKCRLLYQMHEPTTMRVGMIPMLSAYAHAQKRDAKGKIVIERPMIYVLCEDDDTRARLNPWGTPNETTPENYVISTWAHYHEDRYMDFRELITSADRIVKREDGNFNVSTDDPMTGILPDDTEVPLSRAKKAEGGFVSVVSAVGTAAVSAVGNAAASAFGSAVSTVTNAVTSPVSTFLRSGGRRIDVDVGSSGESDLDEPPRRVIHVDVGSSGESDSE